MQQNTNRIFFALLRSALSGSALSNEEKAVFTSDMLDELMTTAQKHDVAHLIALGLDENRLTPEGVNSLKKEVMTAVYRHTQLNYEYVRSCGALEAACIPFLPLKGSVLRGYYPKPWMRTSCDVDILVHKEDLERAIACLKSELKYEEGERAPHDVSLFSPGRKQHIELHFDLVEEGRANNANEILKNVWENVSLKGSYNYHYEMSDEFFYFYHIAHMAKHFEIGGCGVRPFIDLWILDRMEGKDTKKRDELLSASGLFTFASMAKELSEAWIEDKPITHTTEKMQEFILKGGVYGTVQNKVALQQGRRGGKGKYLLSRMFIPYDMLKRYYPIIEKHRWLTPFMQIRRWFMIFRPDVAKRAKSELKVNSNLEKSKSDEMNTLLKEIGL